eukprot:2548634-Heterocapsa_arctica.AAC.1
MSQTFKRITHKRKHITKTWRRRCYADGLAKQEFSAFHMRAKPGGSLRWVSCREDEEEDLIFRTC